MRDFKSRVAEEFCLASKVIEDLHSYVLGRRDARAKEWLMYRLDFLLEQTEIAVKRHDDEVAEHEASLRGAV